jgi:hypothetical protein
MDTNHNTPNDSHYKPLTSPNSIRILQLQPSTVSSSEIQCSTIHKTLSECDRDILGGYIALSYVWGSQENLQQIFFEEKPFYVTQNLCDALYHLREPEKVVKLWVDAICINQNDIEERNQQVSMMGAIYTLARHTIIFLGKSSPKVDEVLHQLSLNGSWVDKKCEQEIASGANWKLVAEELLSRPWFYRVWIFQELVLSKDPWVQCGKSRLRWAEFCKFLRKWEEVPSPGRILSDPKLDSRQRSYKILRSLDDARTQFQIDKLQGKSAQNLVNVVLSRRGLGVTDPRDIIFGHMGVAGLDFPLKREGQPAYSMLTVPEYEKSITEVFNDFAKDVVEWSLDITIFSYVDDVSPSPRPHGLASWAQDWTRDPSPYHHRIIDRPLKFEPDLRNKRIQHWLLQNSVLAVGGRALDVISHISEIIPWNISKAIDLRKFGDEFSGTPWPWYGKFAIGGQLDCTRDFPTESWEGIETARKWATYQEIHSLYCQAFGPRTRPLLWSSHICYKGSSGKVKIFASHENSNHLKGGAGIGAVCISDLIFQHTFQKKAKSILAGRRIAILEGGTVVVVPSASRPGDVLFGFSNGKLHSYISDAFIFRPFDPRNSEWSPDPDSLKGISSSLEAWYSDDHELRVSDVFKHYTLVGQCYITGNQNNNRFEWEKVIQVLLVH